MLKTENARPSTWVYVDVRGRDLNSVVTDLRRAVARDVPLPAGVSVAYSGQFEYLQRAAERLKLVVPATLAIIFLLLYLTFGRLDEAALIMATLPFALTGGIWALYLLGYHQSIATGVGFIALAGVSAEFGVVMLIYLKQALAERGPDPSDDDLAAAVREGALLRVRPKAMTVAVILAGLAPILVGHGAGSEVMSRIAAPMIGGMLTAPLLSMLVVPAGYLLLRRRRPTLVSTAAKTGKGTGVITEIDAKDATLTIKHGPIATLGWPAMTMSFRAVPPSLLTGLKVGQKIGFDANQGSGLPEVTAIRKP